MIDILKEVMQYLAFALEGSVAGFAEGKMHGAEGSVDLDGAHHAVAGAPAPHDVPERPAEVLGPERDGQPQGSHAFSLHLR